MTLSFSTFISGFFPLPKSFDILSTYTYYNYILQLSVRGPSEVLQGDSVPIIRSVI